MDYSKELFSPEKDKASQDSMKKAFQKPTYPTEEKPANTNNQQNLLGNVILPKGSGEKTHMSMTIGVETKKKLQGLAKKQGYNSISAFVNDLLTQLVQDQ